MTEQTDLLDQIISMPHVFIVLWFERDTAGEISFDVLFDQEHFLRIRGGLARWEEQRRA